MQGIDAAAAFPAGCDAGLVVLHFEGRPLAGLLQLQPFPLGLFFILDFTLAASPLAFLDLFGLGQFLRFLDRDDQVALALVVEQFFRLLQRLNP